MVVLSTLFAGYHALWKCTHRLSALANTACLLIAGTYDLQLKQLQPVVF